MRKKSHRPRHRTLKLNKPIDQLTEEELALLGDALPPGHPMIDTIASELEKRIQVLITNAPSPELRELAEAAAHPTSFQRFLQATGHNKMADSALRHGSAALTEQAVHRINESNSQPVWIHAADVWNAWPSFVAEVCAGTHPEDFLEADKILNDFMCWMITNRNHEFYQTVGDKEKTAWLRSVAEICVDRRILEWKYILLTEQKRDTFADPEIRDHLLRMAENGAFHLWK